MGTDTTAANGFYYFLVDGSEVVADDGLLVYVDGHDTYQGNTVARTVDSGISGFDVYSGDLIVRDESGSGIANSHISAAKGPLTDTDIFY